MMKGHSERCSDLSTFWDGRKCVACNVEPGHEVSPNCGRDDDGSFHEKAFKPCRENTFNEGNSASCTRCSDCPPRSTLLKSCTSTTDTVCEPQRNETSTSPTSQSYTEPFPQPPQESNLHSAAILAILAVFVTATLLTLSAFMITRKRKKGQQKMCWEKGLVYENKDFSLSNKLIDLEDVLNTNVHSAHLQTVLDNLDVLEELVILLDPETLGIKNTKHLASLCSFPATWITYAYSMKESKSPLKAVLEGVTSRHPDWTVGHLAKLLQQMERNDAIAVLAKLTPSPHMCV
ncbi:IGF-like family receptor 1 [Melanotaenia boesemani]|uniref:IGF-like family receptor 1 n=1 Tax=Melanotaenia boesemani TaxID=1250792 RepID=UPI001C04E552|nr:IGF-like family receptor 1 [Melanotaenia boesemani]